MIPYVEWQTIMVGPIPIRVWGSFVAAGILLGAYMSARFAKRKGLSPDMVWRGATWIVIAAFIGARCMHIFAYEPAYYAANLGEVLKIWHGGFSVIGGFVGAMAGYALFVRKVGMHWLPYADAFIYGLPLGLACGRIGCFLVHDHPGTVTHFFLGVRYPDGQVRHDHGLYEAIQSLALAIVFYALAWRKHADGFFCKVFLVWYGSVRFFLDFFRLVDQRYAGLTPAQYASVVMVVAGIVWFLWDRKRAFTLEQNTSL